MENSPYNLCIPYFSILHTNGLTAFIQWCECYARCDWLLSMIYKSTGTWTTSRETSFLCFVQHGTLFWKFLWGYFGFKQVKALKKNLAGAIYKEKNGPTEKNWKNSVQFENAQTTRNLHNHCHHVSSLRDSLFCKMFSPLFCFKQEKTLKTFSKKLYTSIKEEK